MADNPQQTRLPRFLAFLIPNESIIITQILVYLNVAVFIYMIVNGVNALQPNPEDLVRWGSNFGLKTLDSEWWRAISCMFIHIGVIHIFFNMYALLSLGVLIEPLVGKMRYIVAYFFSGLFASVSSLVWNPAVNSAGASGAIFGVLGLLLVVIFLNPRHIDESIKKRLLINIAVIIVINLSLGLLPGIDIAAHIGGLIGGIVIGLMYYPAMSKQRTFNYQLANTGIAALVMLAAVAAIYFSVPRGVVRFEGVYNGVAEVEKQTMETYYDYVSNYTGTRKADFVKKLGDGVALWDRSISNLKSLAGLPPRFQKRAGMLVEYCGLRREVFAVFLRQISNNRPYAAELEGLDKKIEDFVSRYTNTAR